jgi:excinuclease UvrABC ATPase subunit
MKKLVFIDEIKWKASPRVRETLVAEVVDDYAERYRKGEKLPLPEIALLEDGTLLCIDGMHRLHAIKKNGGKATQCEVTKLDVDETIKAALASNRAHGLRRSNADKRQCCVLALSRWPDKSNLALSQLVGVDDKTVNEVRKELEKAGKLSKETVRKDTKDRTVTPRETKPKVDEELTDYTGFVIPKEIRGAWEEAGATAMSLDDKVGSARAELIQANKDKSILFSEVNFSAAIGDLEKAMHAIRVVEPYAVCPTCNGYPNLNEKPCVMCKGRGFISKFRWDATVPDETKKLRKKLAKQEAK